jgi:hypothetical protein
MNDPPNADIVNSDKYREMAALSASSGRRQLWTQLVDEGQERVNDSRITMLQATGCSAKYSRLSGGFC